MPPTLPRTDPAALLSWSTLGDYLGGLRTRTVRLGVTGLSRAGKTVFITALVRNLVEGGRLPFFSADAEGRLLSAVLEPQPDDALPRFDYETHLKALASDPPQWPESTRRISQLRLTLTYHSSDPVRRALGPQRLHIDIVDYPGEWLTDLALLDQSYAQWAADAIAKAQGPARAAISGEWLAFAEAADPSGGADEQRAIRGAALFTRYLEASKAAADGAAALTPGRFLMPGDLAGSPLLTFFPLDLKGAEPQPGSLAAMMARRFESYKEEAVRPFFRRHFLKLDRQIVLVDVLSALSRGPEATANLEDAMTGVLKAFRPERASWLWNLWSRARQADRVLIAATKADHLNRTSYDRLEAILQLLTERAAARATAAGADVRVMALAALRATREAEARADGETLPCIAGVPLPGELVGGVTFDGVREAVIFPGDLPSDPAEALDRAASPSTAAATFVRFRPRRLLPAGPSGQTVPAPHIRLDRALEYLFGDRLQ